MLETKNRRIAIAILGAMVVVLVVAAAALFAQDGSNQPVRIILPTPGESNPGASDLQEPSAKPPAGSEVRVYITGAVNRPGVYLLNPGDRLEDALEAAGDGTSEADLSAVNLALRVQDEAHYRVPSFGETPDPESNAVSDPATSQGAGGLIDLNTAPSELLESLPGIGPVRAKAIVADRELNGPFLTVEQITRVAGVGAGTYVGIRDLVTIDGLP